MFRENLDNSTISFKLSRFEKVKIRECACKLHIRISDLIRLAVREYLEKNKDILEKITLNETYHMFKDEELNVLASDKQER